MSGERIETTGELDALPYDTTVIDRDGDAWQYRGVGLRTGGRSTWICTGADQDACLGDYLPATVVYRPDRDLIAEAEARGAVRALLSAADEAFEYGNLREFSYWLRSRAEQVGGADG